ncbi:MAG: hypothetical protein M1605_01575 [Candidatus Thermoplasmatota archaeon]|nr:hypothetical protein [Candidatus Thermoplasmatota archaeon]
MTALYTQLMGLVDQIMYNPLTDLKFLIPIILIVGISSATRHYYRKSSLISPPSFEQNREKFTVPANEFNQEIMKVMGMDDKHFLDIVDSEMANIELLWKKYRNARKRYEKLERKIRMSLRYRRRNGEKAKKEAFAELLSIYEDLKRAKMTVLEVEMKND